MEKVGGKLQDSSPFVARDPQVTYNNNLHLLLQNPGRG